ncbi:MAG: 16S rRNA (uracil(1498)-N(3))-methyltransferase [Clostridia bacterium]|nr:16S rRNA (uracil(1498)-N(3))-methyltransferase [Clostridia bacterium]
MARRFIVNREDIQYIDDNHMEIFGKEVKHIQVLRHNIGDHIIVNEYDCNITNMCSHSVKLQILKETEPIGIPNIDVTLYIGMLKNDKMDFVVQKAVELGVKNVIPFFSKNVVVKLDNQSRIKRMEKLQVVANEACKQCGRTDLVKVCEFEEFNKMLESIKHFDSTIIAYENDKTSLKETIQNMKDSKIVKNIAIIIGAEGGFDKTEVEKMLENDNIYIVSLGTRILRAETAALNLLSIVMYELDS